MDQAVATATLKKKSTKGSARSAAAKGAAGIAPIQTLSPEAAEIDLGIAVDAPDGRQQYRDLLRKWILDKDSNARIGEGESYADVQRRFLPFMRELMNRHADDTGVVVVVSHGALLGIFVPALASNVPADFVMNHPLSNTSIIKTELRDGKLFCTEWAGIDAADFGS